MKYRAKCSHVVIEEDPRPFKARVIRAGIDEVESDKDIENNKWPLYYTAEALASPSISCQNNLVTITVAGVDSVYYTTDGSTPDTTKKKYTGPFAITSTVTVKAISYLGDIASSVASKSCTYTAPPSAPSISVADNTVTISCPTADSIYYTTDSSEPSSSKTKYTAPFAISATTTVNAVGYKGTIKGAVATQECAYTDPGTESEVIG